jgi:multifunctional methyltransferase subunit TRM112
MLQCHAKDCITDNYPLSLEDIELETLNVPIDAEFILRMLSRVDYPALLYTCSTVKIANTVGY